MLKVSENQNIVTVSLDRAESRNAFHPELIAKITETFQALAKRNDVRAVVLKGEGKVFCAGADLAWMKSMAHFTFDQNLKDSEKLFEMFESILQCPTPVIASVHGAAFGGALGLIAACDYVVAEEKTQLCFSEVKIGLVPAVISAFILKKASPGQVSHLMMSGKVFAPKDVVGSLVHEVVPSNEMSGALDKIMRYFQESGPEAVRETKKLIQKISSISWFDAKKETCRVISERRVSSEGQEGLQSFFEKRKANWVK